MRHETCRSCGRMMAWARTPTGKAIPLDPEPCPDGNMVLADGVARVAGAADAGRPLFKTHFATCAFAKQHRKPRG